MSVGIAMIARNGASTMPAALDPFVGIVDDIAIVLGGESTDNTEEVAKRYTTKVKPYQGNGVFHFGNARQQAFDLLETDWIVTVDCDDLWTGANNLPQIIEWADRENASIIQAAYKISNGQFYQPRAFRRGVGAWEGRVHEVFKVPNPQDVIVIKTSDLTVTQPRPDALPEHRQGQNIALGEEVLKREPYNLRAMSHLARDYMAAGNTTKAIQLFNRYLDTVKIKEEQTEGGLEVRYDSEYLSVLENKAGLLLEMDVEEALLTAIKALQVKASAMAYSTFGEACFRLAKGCPELYHLAIYAADKALAQGKPRGLQWQQIELSTTVPSTIKAMSLYSLHRYEEALHAADLGLMIKPDDERLQEVQRKIAHKMNEAI